MKRVAIWLAYVSLQTAAALILVGGLFGCAGQTVYEAAVGANVSSAMPWSNGSDGGFHPSDTVRFTVRREDRRTFCGFSHISHISAGAPFNSKSEDWLDMVECGVRFTSGGR